jgi:hypothetical protein
MNMFVKIKKSFLGLLILSSMPLVAMEIDNPINLSDKIITTSRLVIEQHRGWINRNIDGCKKQLDGNLSDSGDLYEIQSDLKFWSRKLSKLEYMIEELGSNGVSWIIADEIIQSPHGVKRGFNEIKEGQGFSENKRLKTNQDSYKKIYQ